MLNVLAVIGGVAVLYFIGLGVVNHFDKKKGENAKDGN